MGHENIMPKMKSENKQNSSRLCVELASVSVGVGTVQTNYCFLKIKDAF